MYDKIDVTFDRSNPVVETLYEFPKLDYDPDTLTELASALIEVASRE